MGSAWRFAEVVKLVFPGVGHSTYRNTFGKGAGDLVNLENDVIKYVKNCLLRKNEEEKESRLH